MLSERQIVFPHGLDSCRWIHPVQQAFPYLAQYWGHHFFIAGLATSLISSFIAYALLWMLQPIKHPLWALLLLVPALGWLSLLLICANRWLVWQRRLGTFNATAILYALAIIVAENLNVFVLGFVGYEIRPLSEMLNLPWYFAFAIYALLLHSGLQSRLKRSNEKGEQVS
jgi:hypothetical protein